MALDASQVDDQGRPLPAGFTNTRLQPTTGDTITGQGPPTPTTADMVARLSSGNPNASSTNPNDGIIAAPDSATQTRDANFQTFGTGFPTAEDAARVSGAGWRGRGQNPILQQHKDAREEIANQLAVVREAAALHREAQSDADTHGFFHSMLDKPLDVNSDNFEQEFAARRGQFAHGDEKAINEYMAPILKARERVTAAQQAGGIQAYEPESYARKEFQDTLKSTRNFTQAKAAADRVSKNEDKLQGHYKAGLLRPEDFGDENTWKTTGLFHTSGADYGKPNWTAINELASKRASGEEPGAQITRAGADEARKVIAGLSKIDADSLTEEQKVSLADAQQIQKQWLAQQTGTKASPNIKKYLGFSVNPTPTPAETPAP